MVLDKINALYAHEDFFSKLQEGKFQIHKDDNTILFHSDNIEKDDCYILSILNPSIIVRDNLQLFLKLYLYLVFAFTICKLVSFIPIPYEQWYANFITAGATIFTAYFGYIHSVNSNNYKYLSDLYNKINIDKNENEWPIEMKNKCLWALDCLKYDLRYDDSFKYEFDVILNFAYVISHFYEENPLEEICLFTQNAKGASYLIINHELTEKVKSDISIIEAKILQESLHCLNQANYQYRIKKIKESVS